MDRYINKDLIGTLKGEIEFKEGVLNGLNSEQFRLNIKIQTLRIKVKKDLSFLIELEETSNKFLNNKKEIDKVIIELGQKFSKLINLEFNIDYFEKTVYFINDLLIKEMDVDFLFTSSTLFILRFYIKGNCNIVNIHYTEEEKLTINKYDCFNAENETFDNLEEFFNKVNNQLK